MYHVMYSFSYFLQVENSNMVSKMIGTIWKIEIDAAFNM